MTVQAFRLEADANRYQVLLPTGSEHWDVFGGFTGQTLAPGWSSVPVEVFRDDDQNRNLPASDFPALESHVPVFSGNAADALSSVLQAHGELLPLTCREGSYYAYNVTRVVDVLDLEVSDVRYFKSGGVKRIARHRFSPEGLEGLEIFKIPQTPLMDVFVTDPFVQAVRRAGLTGFLFEES